MPQAVSRHPVIAEAHSRCQDVRLWWEKCYWDRFLLRTLWFPPVSITPPVLHTNIHPHVNLTCRTNGRSLVTHPKKTVLSKILEQWTESYFHFVFESLISGTKSPKQKLLFQDTVYHKDSSCLFRANVHFSYPVPRSYKLNYITAWISSQALWLDTFKDVIGYAFFRFTGKSKLHYLLPSNKVCSALLSLALSIKQNLY